MTVWNIVTYNVPLAASELAATTFACYNHW